MGKGLQETEGRAPSPGLSLPPGEVTTHRAPAPAVLASGESGALSPLVQDQSLGPRQGGSFPFSAQPSEHVMGIP